MTNIAVRLSKSSVKWDQLKKLINKDELVFFNYLKNKSDSLVEEVNRLPANFEPIDFKKYKEKSPNKLEFIEQLEKISKEEITFPQDKNNTKDKIYERTERLSNKVIKLINENQSIKTKLEEEYRKWKQFPPQEEWCEELIEYYFLDEQGPRMHRWKEDLELFKQHNPVFRDAKNPFA